MNAFYFGPSGRQLYGFFHDAGYTATGAVLICPPWGAEYTNSHRSLRVLARTLAERGHHVLRFDYSGTGDSWGDSTDADLEQWQTDIALAARELRTMSGTDRISLIGMRLGAYVAATAAANLPAVDAIVLWDPVLDGNAWAREVANAHPHRIATEEVIEFGRTLISTRFHQQLTTLAPVDTDVLSRLRSLVITTCDSELTNAAVETLGNAGMQVEHVPDISPWLGDMAIDHGQLPGRALRRIVEWYDGG